MKRRGFLTSLAGLFGAVTCGKLAKAVEPPNKFDIHTAYGSIANMTTEQKGVFADYLLASFGHVGCSRDCRKTYKHDSQGNVMTMARNGAVKATQISIPYGPFSIAMPYDVQKTDVNGALRMTDGKKEWEVTVRELSQDSK